MQPGYSCLVPQCPLIAMYIKKFHLMLMKDLHLSATKSVTDFFRPLPVQKVTPPHRLCFDFGSKTFKVTSMHLEKRKKSIKQVHQVLLGANNYLTVVD